MAERPPFIPIKRAASEHPAGYIFAGTEIIPEIEEKREMSYAFTVDHNTWVNYHNGYEAYERTLQLDKARQEKGMDRTKRVLGLDYLMAGSRWCCGIGEYWGINQHTPSSFNPEVVTDDIFKTFQTTGNKAAMYIIEACNGSCPRLDKLKAHIEEKCLGKLTITNCGHNPNTSTQLWMAIWVIDQGVFQLLNTFKPWGAQYRYYVQYGDQYHAIKSAEDRYNALVAARKAPAAAKSA